MAINRAQAWRLVRRAVAFEVQMWWSLYRWIFRRPPTRDAAAATFGYSKATTPIVWTFIVLNAIEIPGIHLILPWPHVRGIVDILGVYGLIWMFGLLASRTVNPHILDGNGIEVRNGGTQRFAVAWDSVAAVRVRKRTYAKSRALQVEDTPEGAVLSLTVLSQTNVDVVLRQPTVVGMPDGSDRTVTELRCYADDPGALVAWAGSQLETRVSGEK